MNPAMIAELETQRSLMGTRAASLAGELHNTKAELAKTAEKLRKAEERIAELTKAAGPDPVTGEGPQLAAHEKSP